MPLSFPVAPMKAVLGTLPHDDEAWAYEIKWDGYRTLCHVAAGAVRVQSSSGRDVTASYPELADLASCVNAGAAILDGELVALDGDGRPSFELFQRNQTQKAFYAFDVLSIDGTDTVSLAYESRRALLEQVLEPASYWAVPGHRIGDGAALLEVMREQQMEGIVAKQLGRPYQVGRRSAAWRKVKVRRQASLVVGGFTPGEGNRSSTFGSLLLGVAEGDRLRFAGGVGTGFDQATLESLTAALRAMATADCPFVAVPADVRRRRPVWVRPELVATVELAEWTNDGLVRHASFVRSERRQ